MDTFNLRFTSTAILITGGVGATHSAEVFLPAASSSCVLAALPDTREYHSQEGLLLCGGSYYDTSSGHSCLHFSTASGTWARTQHRLLEWRRDHVSWTRGSDVVLMGGQQHGAPTTSEIVKHDGTVEEGFDLKYHAEYDKNI